MNRRLILTDFVLMLLFAGLCHAAGVIKLPQTGQVKCYNASGTEIVCAGTRQDGEIRPGVNWPNPRFTAGTGAEADCVIDNLTGLMWPKNGNLTGSTSNTWNDAINYANNLTLCGHSDWRLPNVNELESLINANESNTYAWLNSQVFSNVQGTDYWSSTTVAGAAGAWIVSMGSGGLIWGNKVNDYFVWPVRTGQVGVSVVSLPKTGQTASYRTGDDGDLQKGAAWPNPRFIVQTDCVTDTLAGLIWARDANLPGSQKTWQEALSFANSRTLCGYSDWRLPNRKELMSLVDRSQSGPALPSGHPFDNVLSDFYWSSTTNGNDTETAWSVYMYGGNVQEYNKAAEAYLWPVRGGRFFSLSPGWNFISLPGVPPNQDIAEVLGDASSHVLIAWGYDNADKVWKVWKPGGPANTLLSMKTGQGYWLNMAGYGAIDMFQWASGSDLPPPTFLPGWNLIGYNGTDGIPIMDVLQLLSGQWWIVWSWTAGLWYGKDVTILDLPPPIQPLTNLYQGKAYWIKMKDTYRPSYGTWDSSAWDNAVWGP
jgi:hypothetical protein